jgi:hypothetical protein
MMSRIKIESEVRFRVELNAIQDAECDALFGCIDAPHFPTLELAASISI